MARPPPAPDPAQFSLFESEAPTDPPPAAPARTPDGTAVPPPAPAPAPAAGGGGLAPASFAHPQANREIRLQDHHVAYALKRARRRTIGFIVGTDGLAVNAPKWVGIADIEGALREKSTWILRKLREQRERAQRQQQARVDWKDGTSIPFLGETVIVVLDPRATGAILHSDATSLPGVPHLTLHVGLPQNAAPEQIRDTVQSWLQRQARRVFEERCRHFAQQLGVRYTRLALSSAQTRWGSASADGSIRLHWRLIHFTPAIIDYVVAHELAHLREMNHSPRFWDVVRSVLPDYEQARGRLREESIVGP